MTELVLLMITFLAAKAANFFFVACGADDMDVGAAVGAWLGAFVVSWLALLFLVGLPDDNPPNLIRLIDWLIWLVFRMISAF